MIQSHYVLFRFVTKGYCRLIYMISTFSYLWDLLLFHFSLIQLLCKPFLSVLSFFSFDRLNVCTSRRSNYDFWLLALDIAEADPAGGGAPPQIEKKVFCWRKIVIFHTKYIKNFALPSARRNFFKCDPPNLKSWIRPCIVKPFFWYLYSSNVLSKNCRNRCYIGTPYTYIHDVLPSSPRYS